jgi:hypothetical protein
VCEERKDRGEDRERKRETIAGHRKRTITLLAALTLKILVERWRLFRFDRYREVDWVCAQHYKGEERRRER